MDDTPAQGDRRAGGRRPRSMLPNLREGLFALFAALVLGAMSGPFDDVPGSFVSAPEVQQEPQETTGRRRQWPTGMINAWV